MASITIVAGCPGSGKTTLSRSLATRRENGLHLVSDDFYAYAAHPIAPTDPAAKHQNETVLSAVARAASGFAEGGYDVFVDGVIGPWILPALLREWSRPEAVSYVVLHCDLETALARVRARQGPGASAGVAQMHGSFAAAEADCRVETEGRSPDEIVNEVEAGLERGRFLLGDQGRA